MARSLYSEEIAHLAADHARRGATNQEIADKLGIDVATLYRWAAQYPVFCEALKQQKDVVDSQVENALLKQALAGNVVAQIFWLKNRRSMEWRDKRDYEVGGPGGSAIEVQMSARPLSQ